MLVPWTLCPEGKALVLTPMRGLSHFNLRCKPQVRSQIETERSSEGEALGRLVGDVA
jgi:hypothetical protein